MKKCTTHPSYSNDGVCPFCLRDRLSIITAGDHPLSSPKSSQTLINLDPPNRGSMASPIPKKSVSENPGVPPSCLSGLTLGRKKRNKMASLVVHPMTRGISPASDEEGGKVGLAGKQSPGRYNSSPPIRRLQSPRSFSSLGLCLSPLGRPMQGSSGGHGGSDMACTVKIRANSNRRCGSAAGGGGGGGAEMGSVLGTCRSRKIADFGKIW